MKRLFCCVLICILLTLGIFALSPDDYGYYDSNDDAVIGVNDVIAHLRDMCDGKKQFSAVQIVRALKASLCFDNIDGTITAVDTDARTVTLYTPLVDEIVVPFSALNTTDYSALDGTTVLLAMEAPFTGASKVFAVCLGKSISAGTHPLSIDVLNTESSNGSHANDSISTASLERSFRDDLILSSTTEADHKQAYRYDNAYYPRVKKVNENLYIMFFMYGKYGRHLYWTTSPDGKEWSNPQTLWGAGDENKFTYTYGPLEGQESIYIAANADACVLDNGEILCVYVVRPESGYKRYPELNGIYMMRGTVSDSNEVTWGEEVRLTETGGWEPFIWQRPDGQIEIYWSNGGPYINMYGFDEDKRSTGVSMILSKDNGYTWLPAYGTAGENTYLYNRVYQEYLGDKIPYGTNEDGTPKYTEAVPYFGGQMPAVTGLYNGKSILAAEVEDMDKVFHISLAISEENGDWKNLGLLDAGPDTAIVNPIETKSAAPYLSRFPSGEVYLTYNASLLEQRGRLISPDGSVIDDGIFFANPGAKSAWGASEVVESHKVFSTYPNVGDSAGNRSIYLSTAYLNHRTNAKQFGGTVDGYTDDWAYNTDALFVGSESQAQLAVQTAHDDGNIYFLISRLDQKLNVGDAAALHVAVGADTYYTVSVAMDGAYTISLGDTVVASGNGVAKIHGSVGDNANNDEGVLVELSVSKAVLGLTDAAEFALAPMLVNVDEEGGATVIDTLTNITFESTSRWPKVVLD